MLKQRCPDSWSRVQRGATYICPLHGGGIHGRDTLLLGTGFPGQILYDQSGKGRRGGGGGGIVTKATHAAADKKTPSAKVAAAVTDRVAGVSFPCGCAGSFEVQIRVDDSSLLASLLLRCVCSVVGVFLAKLKLGVL